MATGVQMAWKDKSSAVFSGGSGQMAVIGELLHRKCNAAIPIVDVGTDVFAFRDDSEDVARIQVKTAPGQRYKNVKGYHARFGIPMKQLRPTDAPPLFYALAVRLEKGWGSIIVISRANLKELWNSGLGSENKKSGNLELHIQFRTEEDEHVLEARCGTFNLTDCINAWENLPPLKLPATIDVDEHEAGAAAAPVGGGDTGDPQVTEVTIEDIGPYPPQA
jgi:hypothetical protein